MGAATSNLQSADAADSVRFVAPLEDLQQLEQVGLAEVEFRLHAVHIHTAMPLPGLVQSTDPHITLISLQPRILLVDNFLTTTECQACFLILRIS
ncbi:procollagen-proline 4-dioxygenase activity protein [Trebouxia sp. C0009 RCD-2024]